MFDRIIKLAFGAAVAVAIAGSFTVRARAADLQPAPCLALKPVHAKAHPKLTPRPAPAQASCEARIRTIFANPPGEIEEDIEPIALAPLRYFVFVETTKADYRPCVEPPHFWSTWFDGGTPSVSLPGAAPEIDPAGAPAAVVCLAGLLSVIRGRRK